MKKSLIIAGVAVLGLALLYFSPLNRAVKNAVPVEEVVIEDLPEQQGISIAESPAVSAAVSPGQLLTGITQSVGSSVKSLDDGSSITTVDDGRGNRVESRFLIGERQVKGIIVNTSADGSKQVRIILADGSSRLMASEPVADVISATPSQIATALGVFGDLTVKTTPTPFPDPSPESTPSSSSN